jgi:alkaline phosphatase D
MKHFGIFTLILLIFHQANAQEIKSLNPEKRITKIAFGSCNFEFHTQPLWPKIAENNPDLWIWLGDNVYSDTEDMQVMQEKYDQQNSNKNYIQFKKNIPIIGIWDDHDYGGDNQGIHYPMKNESQQLFLNFIGEPQNTQRRNQKGIYTSYTLGKGAEKVKIILLDTRFFKENPGKDSDLLGAAQWEWLEQEFKNSSEENIPINIIASGIQFLANSRIIEKWNDYPQSVNKMYTLLEKYQPRGLLFISGDVHYGEILEHKVDTSKLILREITSSGLTHSNYPQPLFTNNKYTIDEPYTGIQYGMIRIDWKENPEVTLQILNRKNKVKGEYSFKVK